MKVRIVDVLINEIADLRFLTLVISQKAFEIADFSDFEETFRSEMSGENVSKNQKTSAILNMLL